MDIDRLADKIAARIVERLGFYFVICVWIYLGACGLKWGLQQLGIWEMIGGR